MIWESLRVSSPSLRSWFAWLRAFWSAMVYDLPRLAMVCSKSWAVEVSVRSLEPVEAEKPEAALWRRVVEVAAVWFCRMVCICCAAMCPCSAVSRSMP